MDVMEAQVSRNLLLCMTHREQKYGGSNVRLEKKLESVWYVPSSVADGRPLPVPPHRPHIPLVSAYNRHQESNLNDQTFLVERSSFHLSLVNSLIEVKTGMTCGPKDFSTPVHAHKWDIRDRWRVVQSHWQK